MTPEPVGCVVVGGGPGGIEASTGFARQGIRTVIVERAKIGGTCLHVGCIPAKLLLDRAHHLGGSDPDVAWKEFRRDLVATIARHERGAAQLLRQAGVEVVRGEARPHSGGISVIGGDGQKRLFLPQHLVVATGSAPAPAPFPVAGKALLTSDDIFNLEALPRSLVVIGGGAVGVELADAFFRFGTAVTLVEVAEQLLPGEDPEASAILAEALSSQGVDLRLGRGVVGVEQGPGLRTVRLNDGEVLHAETVLLAVGRRADPNPWSAPDGVRVQTIGDAAGGGLAHEAAAMGQSAADVAGGGAPRPLGTLARCVYTSPAVVGVGLTAADAIRRGAAVVEGRAAWSANPMADVAGLRGLTKVVADRATGRLLGVHLVGEGTPELAALAAALLDFEAGLEDMRWLVFPHPTLSETLRSAVVDACQSLEQPHDG
ncbi:MAG TPA: NAD(P)/FAD-dependent oxidoreductase [Acidimicrobiia bacterium]|nr:NAD(P)/FAD-dependent oxidoreductase [Acidimicrobiia bacterium]